MPLLAVVALTTACNPFTYRNTLAAAPTQCPQDPYFPTFTYDTADELKVEGRVGVFNTRAPELGATAGHVVVAYFRDDASRMPAPDHQFWVTGVAKVLDTTITIPAGGNIGASSLLPGIHPSLYEYIPRRYTFMTVNPAVTDKILGIDLEAVYSEWGPFEIREFAVPADCNLIIVIGGGLDTWCQYLGHP